MDSRQPKWWEFWKSNPEPYTAHDQIREEYEKAMIISEPVLSIVKAMISDRKRFVVQKDTHDRYTILDLVTAEEFCVFVYTCTSFDLAKGIDWATKEEIIWAFNKVIDHYDCLNRRSVRIKNARERNRLIEIYA